MKLTIRARHLDLAPALRDQIHRRLHFALGRLAAEISGIVDHQRDRRLSTSLLLESVLGDLVSRYAMVRRETATTTAAAISIALESIASRSITIELPPTKTRTRTPRAVDTTTTAHTASQPSSASHVRIRTSSENANGTHGSAEIMDEPPR